MSLRARLLILLVLTNLVGLGLIQVTAEQMKNRFFKDTVQHHVALLQGGLGYFLAEGISVVAREEAVYVKTVRRILSHSGFAQFRDILISKGTEVENQVDINPLGCSHRDHMTFDMDAVLAGIREAQAADRVVSVGEGRCVPLKSAGGRIEGGAWFVPAVPPEPKLGFLDYALPLLGCMLLFGFAATWIVGRTVSRPLETFGRAARQVESGDYSTRVPPFEAPELRPLAEAFNEMATKVEGHTDELERKVEKATQEAAAKERAMVAASRLASLGTLAAGVAHEINNPIGGMLNAVNRLAQDESRDARDKRYLALVQDGLERVARTSRKLLDFTPRAIEPVAYQLRGAVEQAVELVEHRLARQGVALVMDLPDTLPTLMGEPNEVQQVFLNLILNSLNAMQGLHDRHIWIAAEVEDERMAVTVTDDGPGVDEETLRRVLDPFFSTSNAPDSTGLGLFICYTILQNHGGTMAVESQPGEGFTVRIGLQIGPRA